MSNNFITYSLKSENLNQNVNVLRTRKSFTFYYPCDVTYQCQPYSIQLNRGIYKFEAWAPFSDDYLGSYVSGVIRLTNTTSFLIYIGGKPHDERGGYNGGGNGLRGYASGGAGATDIRLDKSPNSRIMVAAGSGGHDSRGSGPAGTSIGLSCDSELCGGGGTQTEGGSGTPPGSFGQGGTSDSIDGGGGGGGYWGGGHGLTAWGGGGGGSSFVSGHPHCVAVQSASSTASAGTPIHYSGLVFESPLMIGALEPIPDPDDPTKHLSLDRQMNGVFRITLIESQTECRVLKIPFVAFASFVAIAMN